jgi:hypothetical protein
LWRGLHLPLLPLLLQCFCLPSGGCPSHNIGVWWVWQNTFGNGRSRGDLNATPAKIGLNARRDTAAHYVAAWECH